MERISTETSSEEAGIAVVAQDWRVDAVRGATVRSRGSVALVVRSANDTVGELLRGRSVVLGALSRERRNGQTNAGGEGLRTKVSVVTRLHNGIGGRDVSVSIRSDGHLHLVLFGSHYGASATTSSVVGRHLGLNLSAVRGAANTG